MGSNATKIDTLNPQADSRAAVGIVAGQVFKHGKTQAFVERAGGGVIVTNFQRQRGVGRWQTLGELTHQ